MTSQSGRDQNVRKRPFTVRRADEDVPAVMWLPERPARRRPLVLLGHGGGMHKKSPLIDRLGNWLAVGHGIACLAIDLPFHGERTPPQEIALSALERRRRLGLNAWRERNSRATGQAVADWRAAIDAARDDELFPRNDGLALFDLLGSPDKTLHANPGGHLGIPRAEFGDAARFLARRLGGSSVDGDDGGDSTGLLRPPGGFARRDAMG